jgi:tetratricopeptide (TPR) repeat protein
MMQEILAKMSLLMTNTDADPIDDLLIKKVKALCAEGYRHYDNKEYKEALRFFYKAWTALPKPQANYEQGGWVLTAIGDCYFRSGQWEQGRESLSSALHCPNMKGNPFIHLRLGQCLFELGKRDVACEHLEQAYMNSGSKLFQSELPKYLMAAMENIAADAASEDKQGN